MIGLSKPQMSAKFEVASPSRFRNIIGELKILGSSLAQVHPTFSSGCDFMMDLGKPKLCTKFKVASFSRLQKY